MLIVPFHFRRSAVRIPVYQRLGKTGCAKLHSTICTVQYTCRYLFLKSSLNFLIDTNSVYALCFPIKRNAFMRILLCILIPQ